MPRQSVCPALAPAASTASCPTARRDVFRKTPALALPRLCVPHQPHEQEHPMGKYVVAWILGVPAIALAVVYLVFH